MTRYAQPQSGPFQIDSGNPITKGLIDVSQPFDGTWLTSGTVTKPVTKGGVALQGNGSSSYYYKNTAPDLSGTSATILAVVCGAAATVDTRIYSFGSSGSTNSILSIGSGQTDATKLRPWARDKNSNTPSTGSNGTYQLFEAGVPHVGIIVCTPNALVSYVDGKTDFTLATGPSTGWSDANRTAVGALLRSTASSFNSAPLLLGIAWNRALSASEIASISANPWQIFADEDTSWLVAPAGGGTTISCTPGNAVADGVTASIVRSIPAAPGNASADGVTASIVRSIPASPGGAVADGVTTSIVRTIPATPGNAVADGITATITTSGTTTISCTPGNSVADGVLASVRLTIAVTPGNATADGLLAGVVRGIPASPGNAVADGVQASILSATVISCQPGGAVADGAQANIVSGTSYTNEIDLSRKWYVRSGKKIHIFTTAEDADAFIDSEKAAQDAVQAAHKSSRLARKRLRQKIVKIEAEQTVQIDALQKLVEKFNIPADIPSLIAQEEYSRVMQIMELARQMQDEEDVEMLLMW